MPPPRVEVLGVPLALTDYERTMDWMDATIAQRGGLHLRRRRPHRDGLPGGPGAARRGLQRLAHRARRPAARVGDERARPRPPQPRLRPRPDGALLRARAARPARGCSSTAAATRARSSSSRSTCARATPACRSSAATRRRSARSPTRRSDAVVAEINRSERRRRLGRHRRAQAGEVDGRACATASTRPCSSASAPRSTSTPGLVPQAPALDAAVGLEWLFRLAQEPRRLWRRYLALQPALRGRVRAPVRAPSPRRARGDFASLASR